jgi:hypothetical protein
VARALIVGCGCRGRELGRGLLDDGWQVRGTTRSPDRVPDIEAADIDAVVADPGRVGTILDQVSDVTLLYWLLGSALGPPQDVAALHGPWLERLLTEIVDTPVRGFVYEGNGAVAAAQRERGGDLVRAAGSRWRIPVTVSRADPGDWREWRDEMVAVATALTDAG